MIALAHPGLLWTGLALAAVPILIHLFFRRRHRVVRWAAMEFLLAALRKQKRRIEIENLILLLLRIALIALLGFAIARPAVQAASLNPFGGGARAVALVIDTSASMGAVLNGRTMLDRARERATQVLLDLPEESRVTLVVTRGDGGGGAPRALLENASPSDARARLSGLQLSFGSNELADVFRLAGRKLNALRGRRMMVFLTDMQRRDWLPEGVRSDDIFGAIKMMRGEAEKAPPAVLIDVGGGEAGNVVVTDLVIDEGRQAFAPSVLGLSASVANYGSSPVSGRLTLYVGRPNGGWERKQSAEVTDVVPNLTSAIDATASRTPVQFHLQLRKEDEGPLPIKVVFEPAEGGRDRLTLDNERYLSVVARPPVRFLPVRSAAGALSVLRDMEPVEVIEIDPAIHPNTLSQEDLSEIDVVLWADADIHDADAEGIEKITEFVRNGGGLLAYFGKYAESARTNSLFFKERGEGLLPIPLDGRWLEDDDNPTKFDVLNGTGDLFREMSQSSELFYSPDVTGFRRFKDEATLDDHVVARYTNGRAAILTHKIGRGRIIIFSTTPDERGITLNGSILPAALFFNAAHYLVEQDPRLRNVEVGEAITIMLPDGAQEVTIEPPDRAGGSVRDPVADATKPFKLTDTAFPGLYRITVRGVAAASTQARPIEEQHLAAVNLVPAEGDLRRVGSPTLLKEYRGASLLFSTDVDEVLPAAATGQDDELARTILAIVIGILALELFLAWRFGNRRRVASE